jgi:hypothetical protein
MEPLNGPSENGPSEFTIVQGLHDYEISKDGIVRRREDGKKISVNVSHEG